MYLIPIPVYQAYNIVIFKFRSKLRIISYLPTLSCTDHNQLFQIIPYCYINTITYLTGGIWYLHCDLIGRVATLIANDFEKSLRHIGPSQIVAEYRAMWMLLAKITRNVGMASCFQVLFVTLYLFLIITLTIYGLLSQIQEGFGIKDVGLTITAALAIILLYFICDEAHYATNCVSKTWSWHFWLFEVTYWFDSRWKFCFKRSCFWLNCLGWMKMLNKRFDTFLNVKKWIVLKMLFLDSNVPTCDRNEWNQY